MESGTFEPLCPDEGYTEMELNLAFGGMDELVHEKDKTTLFHF
jgi:hypothetical protein